MVVDASGCVWGLERTASLSFRGLSFEVLHRRVELMGTQLRHGFKDGIIVSGGDRRRAHDVTLEDDLCLRLEQGG